MSSPRVLRTVVTMPAWISTSAKACTRALVLRTRPEAGKGLNGIRLILQLTWPFNSLTSAWANSGESFTSCSMQYSKVMKSRGAFSR